MNWAVKLVAMAFMLSTVEERTKEARSSCWQPGNSLDIVGCGLKLILPEMAHKSCRSSSSFALS